MAFRDLAQRDWRVVAVLVAWVAAVVAAAGSRAPERTWLGVTHIDKLFIAAVVVWSLVGLATLIIINPFRQWKGAQQRSRGGRSFVLFMAILALLLWRPEILADLDFSLDVDQDGSTQAGEQAAGAAEDEANQTFVPVAQLTDILLVLAAAGVAGLLLSRLRQEAAEEPPGDESPKDQENEAELKAVIARARQQLELGQDPRAAVLEAYATMEAFVERLGVGRAPSETANEHIGRVLNQFAMDVDPLLNLARLYERARFSTQPITLMDQTRAAAELQRSQQQLALQQ